MIIGVVLIFGLIYYMSNQNGFGKMGSNRSDAEEILKRRFVEGEIDEKEYRDKREILRR